MERAHPKAAEAVLTFQPEAGGGWGPGPTLGPTAGGNPAVTGQAPTGSAGTAALASLSSAPWWMWVGGAALAYFLFTRRR